MFGPCVVIRSWSCSRHAVSMGTRCPWTRVRRRNCGRKAQNVNTMVRSSEGSAEDAKWAQIVSPGPPRTQIVPILRPGRTQILFIYYGFWTQLPQRGPTQKLLVLQEDQTQKVFVLHEDQTQNTKTTQNFLRKTQIPKKQKMCLRFAFCVGGGLA